MSATTQKVILTMIMINVVVALALNMSAVQSWNAAQGEEDWTSAVYQTSSIGAEIDQRTRDRSDESSEDDGQRDNEITVINPFSAGKALWNAFKISTGLSLFEGQGAIGVIVASMLTFFNTILAILVFIEGYSFFVNRRTP